MMYRPGGYSSEEDSDEYDTGEGLRNNSSSHARILTDEEKFQNKLQELYSFIMMGYNENILKIINEGISVNIKFKDDWTPLLLAASTGNVELAIELVNRRADVNQARESLTPLMAACSCPLTTAPGEQSARIVEHLILNKADVNAKNRKRMTPLMFAASTGNVEAVNLLLPLCNKNDEDNQGWTALFWAVNDNHLKIVQILLEDGLDYDKVDIRRLKPLDYAKQHGYFKIAELLPDPTRENDITVIYNTYYDLEQEITRPKFTRDIFLMLHGMNSENLINKFAQSDLDLYSFLTLTLADLERLEIKMPYQQFKILGGLYKYHKHPYLKKSIHVTPKDSLYTTIDVAKSVMSVLRQLISMRASIKYLTINMSNQADQEGVLVKKIQEIESKLTDVEYMAYALKKRCKKWDRENSPVDLITYKPKPLAIRKWIPFIATCACTVIIIKRHSVMEFCSNNASRLFDI